MLLLKLCFRNGLHRLYCLCLLPRLFLDDISAFSLIRANWKLMIFMWVFPKIGVPPKWMVKIMENPIKMDDLGETPMCILARDPPLPLPLLRRELPLFASFPWHPDLTGNPRRKTPRKR